MYVWFPPHKGEEMGKKALEVMQKFPEDPNIGKLILNGALMRTELGIQGVTITQINEGKTQVALDRANEMMQIYTEIEGVNARFDLMATFEESLEMIGMKMP